MSPSNGKQLGVRKVLSIDAAAHKMAVAPLIAQNPPAPTQISLPPDVQYRAYPMTALRISDATPIAFKDLQPGDTVYVHGKGAPGEPESAGNACT